MRERAEGISPRRVESSHQSIPCWMLRITALVSLQGAPSPVVLPFKSMLVVYNLRVYALSSSLR